MKMTLTAPLKPSYWMKSCGLMHAETPPLSGHHSVDVLIIGGGFVGLWTALTIKESEPDANVMILEQNICGGGASGRNGGFAMSWWPKIGTIRGFCSEAESLFLGENAERAIYELGEFCTENNIDAHFRQSGWIWTATTPKHVDSWNATLAACEKLGVTPFERLSPSEVARRTGSAKHIAGVYERSNATVQPARLAQGLRRVALSKGIVIHEKSGVTSITHGSTVQIATAQGSVQAKSVVLATNAWSALLPDIGSLIVPVNSSIVATAPIPERLKEIGWTQGESITDSQLLVDYYRTTNDGRIAFGKGTGAINYGSKISSVFSDDPDSIGLTKADFHRTYPVLADVEIAEHWSGPIDRTYDSLPVFDTLGAHKNIHFGIGWSGNGVGPSRLGGRILSSLALNKNDKWSNSSLVGRKCRRFPPEPFRYVGGSMVRNAVLRKEHAEINGDSPAALDVFLSRFAPSGLEDKS